MKAFLRSLSTFLRITAAGYASSTLTPIT